MMSDVVVRLHIKDSRWEPHDHVLRRSQHTQLTMSMSTAGRDALGSIVLFIVSRYGACESFCSAPHASTIVI